MQLSQLKKTWDEPKLPKFQNGSEVIRTQVFSVESPAVLSTRPPGDNSYC